jgi:hypothetical protein
MTAVGHGTEAGRVLAGGLAAGGRTTPPQWTLDPVPGPAEPVPTSGPR